MTVSGTSRRWPCRLALGVGIVMDLLVSGHWLVLGYVTVFGHDSPGPFAGPVGWAAAGIAFYSLAVIPIALFTAAASVTALGKAAALLVAYSSPVVGAIAFHVYASWTA